MTPNHAADAPRSGERTRRRFFSVESANEALVLVRSVVQDAVDAYQELMRLRAERQELALLLDVEARLESLRERIEQKTERLKVLHQELVDVGCEPRDLTGGLVDFPAALEGRTVWLCWKLGEPAVAWWHESDGGFAGRKPIDAEFRTSVRQALAAETEQVGPH
jgi:hypothetical protein